MNSIASNRVFSPLLTYVYVATIIIISTISIQLLYGFFQFVEMFIQQTAGQVNLYFSQLTKAIN